MSLERSIEISKAPEHHSMALFDEVFSQMQSSVAVKATQAPSDFILFTNIFSTAAAKSQSENGSLTKAADGRQITIDSDGSILVGQPNAMAN
jgi:hypothetical protein